MRKNLLKLVSLMLALSLAFCTTACGQSAEEAAAPQAAAETAAAPAPENSAAEKTEQVLITSEEATTQKLTPEDTLVVGTVFEPVTLDPKLFNQTDFFSAAPVYETLIDKNWDTGEYDPWLATSWEFEDDVTLDIKLRDDVSFSNGAKMTAEDVVFSLERAAESTRFATQYSVIDFENTEIVSDYELKLKLKAPSAPLLGYLTLTTAAIQCKSYFEEVGEDAYQTQPCGTGPFVMTDWKAGSVMCFEKNENYWGKDTAFSKMEIHYYTDASIMFIDYETGGIDMAFNCANEDVQRILSGSVEGTQLSITPTNCTYFFFFYEEDPILGNPLVREAIAHAIDYEALTKLAFGDSLGSVSTSFLGDGCLYKKEIGTYEYDLDLAKSLLAEAGYPDGFSTTYVSNSESLQIAIATGLQSMLAKIGIKLEVSSVDSSAFSSTFRGTENNGIPTCSFGCIGQTPSTGDPDQPLTFISETTSFAACRITDPAFNELYKKGRSSTDDATRAQVYADIQQMIYDEVLVLPICVSNRAYAYHDYIEYADINCPAAVDISWTTFR